MFHCVWFVSLCILHTSWLPGFVRIPHYAPTPCYIHPLHNCHHIKVLPHAMDSSSLKTPPQGTPLDKNQHFTTRCSFCVVSTIIMCGLHHRVWSPSPCVGSITMCGLHHRVWSRMVSITVCGLHQWVVSITVCGLHHRVWSPSQCVVSITVCGLHHRVWSPSPCVVSITVCGLTHRVWSITHLFLVTGQSFIAAGSESGQVSLTQVRVLFP